MALVPGRASGEDEQRVVVEREIATAPTTVERQTDVEKT